MQQQQQQRFHRFRLVCATVKVYLYLWWQWLCVCRQWRIESFIMRNYILLFDYSRGNIAIVIVQVGACSNK